MYEAKRGGGGGVRSYTHSAAAIEEPGLDLLA